MVSQSSLANAIRVLAMDSIQAANSGHPGAPMGMAEIAVALWNRHLRHNPTDPKWANRDRFVLSNGHGSMLLYSLLHLTGYALPLEELKRLTPDAAARAESKTPLEHFAAFYEAQNGQPLSDEQAAFCQSLIEDIWKEDEA